MLPKQRRPREERIVPMARSTYSISEFCEKSGLSRVDVLRLINDGTLRVVKLGHRRLILAQHPNTRSAKTE
jgi:excisionase family DNA binding protein